jgi:hypothetical protein
MADRKMKRTLFIFLSRIFLLVNGNRKIPDRKIERNLFIFLSRIFLLVNGNRKIPDRKIEREALHFPVPHFSVGEWKQENTRQENGKGSP